MPADDGVWLDDDRGVFPTRPDSGKQDPEGSIERSDPRLGSVQRESGELLTQSEFDDCLLIPTSEEGRNAA